MVAHGGESPTRKANARRHVVHADVQRRPTPLHPAPQKTSAHAHHERKKP